MALSTEIISQFAKVIVENDKQYPVEKTVTGTAKSQGGKMYVQLDGSDLLTPIASATAGMRDGDRVTVQIKNHSATVTGNASSPSTGQADLDDAKDELGNQITELGNLVAQKASIEDLEAETARVDDLIADNVAITGKLDAAEADIDKLQADVADLGDLSAVNAEIENLKVTKADIALLEAEYAKIDDLEATNADIHNLEADYGTFKQLTTDNFSAVNADIDDLEATKLSAEQADIKYAQIDFANIGEAAVEELFTKAGIIGDLVMDEGHVTGTLVGVTIVGDLIEGGTVKADKLVIQGTDGLYYKLNVSGETVAAEQTEYNSLNGSIITAKSVTAEKINVSDLVAFDATIGGFHITEDSLYSGVKASVDNTTRGTYMNDDGEFAIGDQNNYLKFFYDETDSKWKLVLSANAIKLGASSSSLEDEIDEIKSSIEQTANEIRAEVSESYQVKGDYATSDDLDDAIAQEVLDRNSAISQSASQIQSTVSQTYATKTALNTVDDKADAAQSAANSAQNDLDDYKTTVSNTYATKSSVTQTAESIKSEVAAEYTTKTEFEGLEIGGTNRVLGTAYSSLSHVTVRGNYGTISVDNSDTVGSRPSLKFVTTLVGSSGSRDIMHDLAYELENENAIVSFWVKGSVAANMMVRIGGGYTAGSASLNKAVTTSWNRLVVDMGTLSGKGSGDTYVIITFNKAGTFRISGMKCEFGTKATDWSPAPEDMASTEYVQTTYATKTALEQTEDSITASVESKYLSKTDASSTYATKTQLEQTEDSITTTVSQVQTIADNAYAKASQVEQTADGIQITLTEVEATANDALDKADAAQDTAEEAQSTANTASSNASTALSTATANGAINLVLDSGPQYDLTRSGTSATMLHRYNLSDYGKTVLTAGTKVCLSYEAKVSSGTESGIPYITNSSGNSVLKAGTSTAVSLNTSWQKFYKNLEIASDGGLYFQFTLSSSSTGNGKTYSIRRVKAFVGEADGYPAWSAAPEDIANAAKTATNYLGFSSNGLVVGTNSSGSGQSGLQGNVRLYNGGMEVRSGTTVLARYGASTIELGKNAATSKVTMCGGNAEVAYGAGVGNNNKTTTITSKNTSTSPSNATIALKAATSSGDGYTTYEFNSNGTITVNQDGTRRELIKHLVYKYDLFPVGTVLIRYDLTSPASLYGGTWARIANGAVLAASGTSSVGGSSGIGTVYGSNTRSITTSHLPAHSHDIDIGTTYPEASNYGAQYGGGFGNRVIVISTADKTSTLSTGSGSAFDVQQLTLRVAVWRRTA